MKFPFFLFQREGKKPLKRFDRTFFRLIKNGPNREELIVDGLRLGKEVDYLGVVFLESFFKHALKNIRIIGVERFYKVDAWIIRFNGGKRDFEAFYSTKTREGYVCNTSKIKKQIWPNGDIYRPLSDYQLMGLLYLVDIVDSETFLKHVLGRIIQSIKGITDYHSYSETSFENEPEEIKQKIALIKNLLFRNRTKKKGVALIAEFRKILG